MKITKHQLMQIIQEEMQNVLQEQLPKLQLSDTELSASPRDLGGDEYELGLSKDLLSKKARRSTGGLTPTVRAGVRGKFGDYPTFEAGGGLKGDDWEAGLTTGLKPEHYPELYNPILPDVRLPAHTGIVPSSNIHFKKGRLGGRFQPFGPEGTEGEVTYDLGKYGKLGAKGGHSPEKGAHGGLQWTGTFEEGLTPEHLARIIDEVLRKLV